SRKSTYGLAALWSSAPEIVEVPELISSGTHQAYGSLHVLPIRPARTCRSRPGIEQAGKRSVSSDSRAVPPILPARNQHRIALHPEAQACPDAAQDRSAPRWFR